MFLLFPQGCANVLSRMLAVDVNHRITMDDLLSHEWLRDPHTSTTFIARQPPVAKLYHTVPKAQVVSYMTTVFNFMEDEIYDSVVERKMNAVAATYHLLQRRFEAGLHLVGFSLNVNNACQKQCHDLKSYSENVELPRIAGEDGAGGETDVNKKSDSELNVKSYAQLLKTSKLRSAQSVRSGPLVLRQKEITLRRYKTRTDMVKDAKPKEEYGFLPDFVLTYSHSDGTSVHSRGSEKFEWEQTFVVNKKEACPLTPPISAGKQSTCGRADQSDFFHNYPSEGRLTQNDLVVPAPPTTPATPPLIPRASSVGVGRQLPPAPRNFLPKGISVKQSITKQGCVSDESESAMDCKAKHVTEQGGHVDSGPLLRRQKMMHFSRYTASLSRQGNVVQQSGQPATGRKILTNKEARSYFEDIEHAKVIGQGKWVSTFG